jgi:hypothetical protein
LYLSPRVFFIIMPTIQNVLRAKMHSQICIRKCTWSTGVWEGRCWSTEIFL